MDEGRAAHVCSASTVAVRLLKGPHSRPAFFFGFHRSGSAPGPGPRTDYCYDTQAGCYRVADAVGLFDKANGAEIEGVWIEAKHYTPYAMQTLVGQLGVYNAERLNRQAGMRLQPLALVFVKTMPSLSHVNAIQCELKRYKLSHRIILCQPNEGRLEEIEQWRAV